ncbi:class I SAM-dependent methyltransferase [Dyadobacter sp. CY312]|uniref:class I SAM-dependent methyltransferase n=1 Tax=Dyadobacter sp. CY312 TaxID=2907303 RepID=UPI001F36C26E|nr:class I SAM-dependent methyltransferase [Dyadobacter sp. CY312]MCE7041516.1 class I SAM-dependent methyltransferase [Dyadobacter sp. CY312]
MDFITLVRNQFLKEPRAYHPQHLTTPEKMIDIVSAWKGLELIIDDLIKRFGLSQDRCIEFGVEFGFSSVAFSNYFKQVTGIDTFEGDEHTDNKEAHYEKTKKSLLAYPNIELVKSDYKDWIIKDTSRYDLAHVDIVHNYKETFECGLWAARHSDCTIFHDTESFPEVKRAVIDIAKRTGQKAYNYPHHFGLGILVDRHSLRKKRRNQ